MTKPATILDAIADENLFGRWFRDVVTWQSWRAFIATLFALPLTGDQLRLYRQCTGRDMPPSSPFYEAWLVCGRRAGKSFVLALVAVYLACFFEYRCYLSPGERATILIIATDRRQARVIFRYVRAFLTLVPMLKKLVARETKDGFDLTNAVTIEIQAASFRSVRGYTLVAVLCDEIAFWPTDDAADPDHAILDAIRPGMATIPNAMLLCASSPYARRGALWEAHRRYYAKQDESVLVWQAATRTMNPTVRQQIITDAYERDEASARAEYGAEFRSDVESFISKEAVAACTEIGVRERPPSSGFNYTAFVDPSGGSADSMTLAIAHAEKQDQIELSVLDAIREIKPPFSPEAVVAEFATLLKSYRVSMVTGDRYAGEWPRERFHVHGISYKPSELTKSQLYQQMLPALNGQRALLLDSSRLQAQLTSLERRTARGGRDSIDHPPNGKDDVANAVAGAVVASLGGVARGKARVLWN